MTVTSIRLDENKKKSLKIIASLENKTMGGIISELIDDYIKKNKDRFAKISEQAELREIMKLSENAFTEWDNDEDEVYNDL